MRFTSYLLNLRRPFPYRYWVNRFMTALPGSSPHIQFLCVRLTICYQLPSSVRYLPDSAESLVLPSIGRTVDFHHQTHVRCWAHMKKAQSRKLRFFMFFNASVTRLRMTAAEPAP